MLSARKGWSAQSAAARAAHGTFHGSPARGFHRLSAATSAAKRSAVLAAWSTRFAAWYPTGERPDSANTEEKPSHPSGM